MHKLVYIYKNLLLETILTHFDVLVLLLHLILLVEMVHKYQYPILQPIKFTSSNYHLFQLFLSISIDSFKFIKEREVTIEKLN